MDLNTITEELRQAYMEQNWESVLECINLLSDFVESNNETSRFQDDVYGDD